MEHGQQFESFDAQVRKARIRDSYMGIFACAILSFLSVFICDSISSLLARSLFYSAPLVSAVICSLLRPIGRVLPFLLFAMLLKKKYAWESNVGGFFPTDALFGSLAAVFAAGFGRFVTHSLFAFLSTKKVFISYTENPVYGSFSADILGIILLCAALAIATAFSFNVLVFTRCGKTNGRVAALVGAILSGFIGTHVGNLISFFCVGLVAGLIFDRTRSFRTAATVSFSGFLMASLYPYLGSGLNMLITAVTLIPTAFFAYKAILNGKGSDLPRDDFVITENRPFKEAFSFLLQVWMLWAFLGLALFRLIPNHIIYKF